MSAALPFPPRETILAYLAEHPETRGVYLQDKKAVKAVAKFFAGRDITYISLNAGVALSQYNAKQKNKTPFEKIAVIQSKFAIALKDCKERKPLPIATPNYIRNIRLLSQATANDADVQNTKVLDEIAIFFASCVERKLTPVATPNNMPPGTLPFPPKETIVLYLAKHRRTSDAYLMNKEVIESVAKFFGKRFLDPLAVDAGVALTLFEANQKMKLSPEVMLIIQGNLVAALRDCAEGKPISLARL